MITETTAISCAAFGALSTGLGIAAGIGWMRSASHYKWAIEGWERACDLHRIWRRETLEQRDKAVARAIDAEDRLQAIERQRSDNTRRGNLTKAAKRKAAIAATTSQLQQNIADRAEPVRQAA